MGSGSTTLTYPHHPPKPPSHPPPTQPQPHQHHPHINNTYNVKMKKCFKFNTLVEKRNSECKIQ
eukprot:Pgem_evm1s18607